MQQTTNVFALFVLVALFVIGAVSVSNLVAELRQPERQAQ